MSDDYIELFGYLIGCLASLLVYVVAPLLVLSAAVWAVVSVLRAMGVL
jgi:hypothetical protein